MTAPGSVQHEPWRSATETGPGPEALPGDAGRHRGLRLLVVAGGTRATASARHRLWNYRPFLEADGVRVTWVEYRGGRLKSPVRAMSARVGLLARLARSAPGHAVILVQKILPPISLVRFWRARGRRVVYDFDDALYEWWWGGESERTARRRKGRFDAMLRAASAVIAGSPPQAAYARRIAASVEVLYPSLDRQRFRDIPRPREVSPPTLGWIGNEQSQVYLRELEPVLEKMLQRHADARLLVCSSVVPDLSATVRERMEFLPWSERAELEAVSRFHVALSPMDREPWSRARGGRVSVLLSMGAGVPVVAAPGGGLEELLEGGSGVLLARTPDEWLCHIDRLLTEPEERERLGREARALVDRKIWAEVQYPRFRRAVFGE